MKQCLLSVSVEPSTSSPTCVACSPCCSALLVSPVLELTVVALSPSPQSHCRPRNSPSTLGHLPSVSNAAPQTRHRPAQPLPTELVEPRNQRSQRASIPRF